MITELNTVYDSLETNQAFWIKKFSGEIPSLDFLPDRSRPLTKSHNYLISQVLFEKDLTDNFNSLLNLQKSTLFEGVLTLVNILLYRYTNQEEFIIGTQVKLDLNDESPNSIALRTIIDGNECFNELLSKVQKIYQEVSINQSYPFDFLLKDLNLTNTPGRHPLFDVMVIANETGDIQKGLDLIFAIKEDNGMFAIDIHYDTEIFESATIERLGSHLKGLLMAINSNSTEAINRLEYLSSNEKDQLLNKYNNIHVDFPRQKTIIDFFEEQVQKTPDNIALVCENRTLTYRELNEKSNQLASYLIDNYQVRPNNLIGIMLERTEWMIVAIIGVLKSGGAYVPIDIEYPEDRINYMKADSQCLLLIDELELNKSQIEGKYSKNNKGTINKPDDLAYVIYTSGTTGLPKGTLIEHRNVVRLFFNDKPLFSFNEHDVWTLFHSYCFDFSVWEMYGALLHGGKLIIIPKFVTKDTSKFYEILKSEAVTILNQTPTAFYNLQEYLLARDEAIKIRYIIFGGEALSPKKLQKWHSFYPECKLINMYGITETTVHVTYKELSNNEITSNISNIGTPIPTLSCYVLDKNKNLVPIGVIGELFVGGAGVARGYLNKPELTEEKFINNPFINNQRLYKSGDKVKMLVSGEMEYLGRNDDQIKIRGHRIELGEIENVLLKYSAIKNVTILVNETSFNNKSLLAYIVSDKNLMTSDIYSYLKGKLPDYMIPDHFIFIDKIPMTTNGKIDKKKLPKPDNKRPELSVLFKKPTTATEIKIANILEEVLNIDKIGLDDNFFELGGNSILAQYTVAALKKKYQFEVPITKIYQYPTITKIAQFINPIENKIEEKYLNNLNKSINQIESDIAIIGMAGRFPGANTIDELWDILKKGKETIHFFNKEELDNNIPFEIRNSPDYVAARGIIDDADKFDAAFFGLNPKLTEAMDPQQRIFLEISWELLEKSGYSPQKYFGNVGVFAGCGNNTYFPNNVQKNSKIIDQVGEFQVMTVNEKDFISSRTSYELNLKGPAVSVFSGCSTSLLAISLAVESIKKGQCEIAIAGGASITSPINSGHLYQEGAMLSSDGHCRSFDAHSTGTVFSDGAGVVLLKNLKQAELDGDIIYAVIKGIGVNNDGGGKGSFTAPSADGQANAITMAIQDAGISPSEITYIETHGTGTPIGDPIEIEGLKKAFGAQQNDHFCGIGSIKSNMGHLTAAAGVAGLIKTTLALYHKQIPASIGFENLNPNIKLQESPFYINTKLSDWNADGKLIAGVSSFGVGGTNVHIILEGYHNPIPISDNSKPLNLITWSAKSEESNQKYANKLAEYLQQNKDCELADIAFTIQKYRSEFNHRNFIISSSVKDCINKLKEIKITDISYKALVERPSEIVFSFPGQGAQYLNMGRDIYENEEVYRTSIDECAEILKGYLNIDIRNIIFSDSVNVLAEDNLKNTKYTQPAIFITEYALSKLWMSWGVQPTILCGHSIGEFVAAHLAGIFSLNDALKLIAYRGIMVSELPKGSMLSVRLDENQLGEILPDELSIAAINTKKLSVVSGSEEQIALFSDELKSMDLPNKLLITSHAFHSAMMNPIVDKFKDIFKEITINKPVKPIISTVTGTWLKDEQAMNPQYWADHLRKTVRFSDALDCISELDNPLFLEVGPGNVTSSLAKQQIVNKKTAILTSIEKDGTLSEYYSILNTLGKLWVNGVEIDWDGFYNHQKRKKIDLPTYAFDKKVFWVEPLNTLYNMNLQNNTETIEDKLNNTDPIQNTISMRKESLFIKIKQLLEDASGLEMTDISPNMSFIEIGLDSLLLTQVALTFKKEFGLPITFRQLNEAYGSPALLIDYLDSNLPKESFNNQPSNVSINNHELDKSNHSASSDPSVINLIAQQIQMLSNQVALMQMGKQSSGQVINSGPLTLPIDKMSEKNTLSDLSPEEAEEIRKPFGATARIEKQKTALSEKQTTFLNEFTKRYNEKTKKSKAYTEKNRAHMADPRVVSGFKPLTKEIVYSIVINRSSGSKLWDIDGNEYIDVLSGFGSNMFGWQPEFIKKAMHEQIELGYEVGPQHELAAEVCALICEFSGHDRSALCSTGSEAVLGALRIARAITGRSLIVAFTGSYHGIVDEVLVRGTKKLKSYPAAAGIMPESVQNMLILDYGTDESLRIIKERGHEIAAVLVEPVQSRRPEFVPIDFLKEVRKITSESGSALIFDEVITGFRMHPGGAQALFGIKADIASYGKVIGAGVPIGVIAGKKEYMDALDGGAWQFGDESFPEIGVTYFAGTFVRHPLALASAKASLNHMKEKGPDLQIGISNKALYLAQSLNNEFEKLELPIYVAQFGSLWKIKYKEEIPYSELLFTLMREKGIHIWDGFPCFMTEAHTDEEVNLIIQYFKESIQEMINAEFFIPKNIAIDKEREESENQTTNPPLPGARLGRDRNGSPAWFITDPDQPGKYIQVS